MIYQNYQRIELTDIVKSSRKKIKPSVLKHNEFCFSHESDDI